MIRLFLALTVGKLIYFLTRILNIGGGSAAPGYYSLQIYPDLVSRLSKGITTQIIITGTNGKTTTSRLVSHFLDTQGVKVLRNSTGSNLERGIASALIKNYSLFKGGLSNKDLAIWEVDEAAFNGVVTQIKPQIIVFLNAFRDQLDRYGEVDSVVNKWCESLKKVSKDTLVIINDDDQNVSKLEDCFSGKVQKFGLKGEKILGENKGVRKNQKLDFEAANIKQNGMDSTSFKLIVNRQSLIVNLPVPGIYHIYDFLAAFAVGSNLNLDSTQMIGSLENYSPAFGRMEKVKLEGKDVYIFLIKNPTGATEVFKTIEPEINRPDTLFVALNDDFADGTDVSWIWDADFEKLTGNRGQSTVIASGVRAYDLALRLKYAGYGEVKVTPDIEQGLDHAVRESKGRVFVLPTYTAMLELQKILTKKGVKKNYWEEK